MRVPGMSPRPTNHDQAMSLPTDYACNLSDAELLDYVSDISKDVRGFRERGLGDLTREQLLDQAAYFERKLDERAEDADIDANWQQYV